MTDLVDVRLQLPRAALEQEQAIAAKELPAASFGTPEPVKASGAGLGKPHFIEPVSAVATVTLAWIAKRLVDHWLKSQEAGVQFDLRTVPATISRVAGVPHGFIVIIDKKGKPTTRQAEYDKPEDLLPTLQEILAAKPAGGG